MLRISKALSASQAQTYHAREFTSPDQSYWSRGQEVPGEWQGQLAERFGLSGSVGAEEFARLSEGQHPLTSDQLVQHRQAYEYQSADGKTIKSVEHRAGWDATFSAPKSISLTALVGGDDRIRDAHRQAVTTALTELERYTQARIGGNNPAETTGQFVAAKFEHDTARPVDGYAAPQIHTHAVIFNVTERGDQDSEHDRRDEPLPAVTLGLLVIAACFSMLAGGCASNPGQQGPINPNLPVGLPPAPPPASTNTFVGTQSSGLWNVTVDETQANFSYQSITQLASPNVPTSGAFLRNIGFLSLTNPNGSPGGYVAEVPGRVLALQPGSDMAPLVFSVQQDSCFAINGNVKFQFVQLPESLNNSTTNYPAYGMISAQTSPDGSTWMFGGQVQYQMPLTLEDPAATPAISPIPPGTVLDNPETYLPTFSGNCAVSNGVASISAAPNVSSVAPVSKLPTTFVIGRTGFFLEDQATGSQTSQKPDATSFVGAIQPAAPLNTASIVAGTYAGFMRHASIGPLVSLTQPIGFGQITAGSGTSLTGGTFLNDDISQFQNSNIVINLGAQDAANNGLYPLASITMPDPKGYCYNGWYNPTFPGLTTGTPGVDQFGNETCTFNAVAVVAYAESKYSIFIAATDIIYNDTATSVPMGIYLFQQ